MSRPLLLAGMVAALLGCFDRKPRELRAGECWQSRQCPSRFGCRREPRLWPASGFSDEPGVCLPRCHEPGGCDGGTCVMSTERTEFLREGFCEAR